VKEVNAIAGSVFRFMTLDEAGYSHDIPEPYETLEENAFTKARQVQLETGFSCFSEDSGLFVDALGGEPGVRSARYAGENSNVEDNIQKLLQGLSACSNRSATFRTVVCLLIDDQVYYFSGECHGKITHEVQGSGGFGYDPVFIPDGDHRSFAEMSPEEKNRFSHRKKAIRLLIDFLMNYENPHTIS